MTDTAPPEAERSHRVIYRHAVATRLWHWVNAVAIFIMIGSGLMISNAHPRLYWGAFGANPDHAWLEVPHWPGWITIPSTYNLSFARRWHLLFAFVLAFGLLAYIIASLVNRHFQRDLRVRGRELGPRHLWADVVAHLKLQFHNPDDPGAYNTLQKFAYVAAIFVLIPLMIATGLAISPGMDAAAPWLLDLFGGRQSARSIHFLTCWAIIGFVVVHLALVILAGVRAEVGSMITGRWRLPEHEA
jgi:Ni/Fe-hydrogenase b-type cytochrome subunit